MAPLLDRKIKATPPAWHRHKYYQKKKRRKRKPLFPLFKARSPQQALAKKGILFRGSERQDERENLHFSA